MKYTLRQIGDNTGDHHIVFFPYAGAGSDAYFGVRKFLPPKFVLWAADLPGHLQRAYETPFLKFTEAINDFSQTVIDRFKDSHEPLMFYGHSMGGYLAVETASAIELLDKSLVKHIILGACASPDRVDFSYFYTLAHASDAILLDVIKSWGFPIPEDLLHSSAAINMILHSLRSDLSLLSTYNANPSQIAAPISVLYGSADNHAHARHCLGWSRYTAAWKGLTELNDGHLFIATQPQRVAEELIAALNDRHTKYT